MDAKLSRRTLLKWLGVSATTTALAACAIPQAPAGSGSAPAQAAIEISWARHGADADLVTENALAKFFAAKHSGVTIKPLVLSWDDYNTKIPVMVAGGTAPDTFGCHPALLTDTYHAKGLIVIGDYIDANAAAVNYKDVLYPGDATYDGKIVGLPQKSCTHQLQYNKKLFADAGMKNPGQLYWEKGAAGWNWNTFVEMGKTLTKSLSGSGKPDQYFFSGQDSTSIVSFIRSNGGELFNADYTACTLTKPAAVDAIQWMGDLVLKFKIQPPPEMQANQLGINFDTGKMVTASGTTCDSVRSLRKGFELPFGWDFVVLPAGSAGFRCWGDTDQIVISSSSKHANQAFDWMLYRSSKDAWEESYAAGIVLAYSDGPTRWSIFNSKAFTEPLAAIDVKMISEGYKFTIPNPYTPRSPQANRVVNTILPTEIDNVVRGVKTAAQAATDMCTQLDQILKSA